MFMALAGPMTLRVLAALGIGVVSYLSIQTFVNNAINQVLSSYAGIGEFPLALLNLAGANAYLTIVTSAIVARLSLVALKKLRFLL